MDPKMNRREFMLFAGATAFIAACGGDKKKKKGNTPSVK